MKRRAKYHDWITEDGLLKLEGMARDGLTDIEIAAKIGVARDSLRTWRCKFPEVENALKRGKDVVDRKVEKSLLQRALGYQYTEKVVEIDDDGSEKVKVFYKQMPPDTTAQIFWLKNRKPDEWLEKRKVEANIEVEDISVLAELLK